MYVDADYANDTRDRKSVTGFVMLCNGQLISAKSWKQPTIAMSTCEAEIMAASDGVKEGLWLEQLIGELGLHREPTIVYCDSNSALALMQNPGAHKRTKHIDIRALKIREVVTVNGWQLKRVSSAKNTADMMTKLLPDRSLSEHRSSSGVVTARSQWDE